MPLESEQNNIPVLAPDYYLTNFLTLVDYVLNQYQNLLFPQETEFVTALKGLSDDAQKLYVRLISRKGPSFRQDKLKYSEIGNIEAAVIELHNNCFLSVNHGIELAYALQVLTKPDLIILVRALADGVADCKLTNLTRAELVDVIVEYEENRIWEIIKGNWRLVIPCHVEIVSLFFLLFFGNMEQNLSDFILEDIGVLKYEPYEIRKEDRLFTERKVLDDYITMYNLRILLWEAIEQNETDIVLKIGQACVELKVSDSLKRKLEKSYNEIGGFLERQKELDKALKFYGKADIPPSRERRARILDKTGLRGEALELTNQILSDPFNDDELEFAIHFSEKLKKKLALPYQVIKMDQFGRMEIFLERDPDLNIESVVLNHFLSEGKQGFYSENGIWTALFGLMFWDIIFMPMPGVFFNPFQRGPVDIFHPEFSDRRKVELARRLAEMEGSKDWYKLIMDRYDKKQSTANFLVPWKRISREQVEMILSWIPKRDILVVLERMSGRLKEFRSGFPDLVTYDPENQEYCLMEVKGPGDQLRPNQKRWLRFFEEKGIPYKVLMVKWKE